MLNRYHAVAVPCILDNGGTVVQFVGDALLVEMAERFGEGADDGIRIALPFSQDELAGWTGASREAVSKALRALRAAGLISTSRMSVTVKDIGTLRRRAD